MRTTEVQPDVPSIDGPACPAGCPKCGQSGELAAGGPVGWRLAGWSAGLFLAPLFLAIAGAVLLPRVWAHPDGELIGGFGGLLAGVVGGMAAARILRPPAARKP